MSWIEALDDVEKLAFIIWRLASEAWVTRVTAIRSILIDLDGLKGSEKK
jgi:hypothetical protein